MRKIILLMHFSIDGFVAGPKGEMNWMSMSSELFEFVSPYIDEIEPLYGRVTYNMMKGYWPTCLDNPKSTPLERHHAQWINDIQKTVVSTTMEKSDWNNTNIIKDDVEEQIKKLKAGNGKNLMVFGSPTLTHSLMKAGLIDEYLLTFQPAVLGEGIPLFKNIATKEKLELITGKIFTNGVIGVHYKKI